MRFDGLRPFSEAHDARSLWPCSLLATDCSHLLELTCSNHFMGQREASACLRLTSILESLSLETTLGLIPDPDLQRLQHLACLSLTGSREDDCNPGPTFSAEGLRGLISLQVFKVSSSPCTRLGSLDAVTFAHSSLTRLEFADDPFEEKVDLTGLPALHTISIVG